MKTLLITFLLIASMATHAAFAENSVTEISSPELMAPNGGTIEYKGIEYLRRKLEQKRIRVLKRYRYYTFRNSKGQTFKVNAVAYGGNWADE